ncbi:Hypothetical protein A7982_11549 [Minicystis rosea]|nr:Hypothetical protein A7982_11549 [Minicystis rosea]
MAAAIAMIPAAGCAPPPPPAAPQAAIVEVVKPAPPPASAPVEEPLPSMEEAMARGRAIAESWNAEARYADEEKRAAWIAKERVDETSTRRLVEALTKPCLAERNREAAACKAAEDTATDAGKAIAALLEVLAEIADPAPLGSASQRLLVRLDTRGMWQADQGLSRILERRMVASFGSCAPPSAAEIAAARQSLADFAVVAPPAAPARGLAARFPTAAELDEIAYFQAIVADAGPAVGSVEEDRSRAPLPKDHPDIAAREQLHDEMRGALLDGEIDHHLRAAEAYLRTLGYPDPLRMAEEGDMRWGGAGVSFVMRDAARSAEVLGRYALAEALYRRPHPGGGMCGTSTASRRDEQIKGIIRAGELRRGCRAVAAERLFAVSLDRHHVYGPERLARAGIDVGRAYAGALYTLGRDDVPELERALKALPTRAGEALARLAQRGPEAWAMRVRAIPGYADTAQRAGLARLLVIAEHGAGTMRGEALEALGWLVEDRGYDPCLETSFGIGWGHASSRLERHVQNVMGICETRVNASSIESTVRRLSALASDPNPEVREAVATTLGRLGAPSARPTLTKLARDPHDVGGQVCTTRGNAPQVCEPNRPIARAARDALEAIQRADALRAKQRAARSSK